MLARRIIPVTSYIENEHFYHSLLISRLTGNRLEKWHHFFRPQE
jgi:hypothetical protein